MTEVFPYFELHSVPSIVYFHTCTLLLIDNLHNPIHLCFEIYKYLCMCSYTSTVLCRFLNFSRLDFYSQSVVILRSLRVSLPMIWSQVFSKFLQAIFVCVAGTVSQESHSKCSFTAFAFWSHANITNLWTRAEAVVLRVLVSWCLLFCLTIILLVSSNMSCFT